MLMQVLSMTPAQINALPVNDQAAILQLVSDYVEYISIAQLILRPKQRAQFMSNAS